MTKEVKATGLKSFSTLGRLCFATGMTVELFTNYCHSLLAERQLEYVIKKWDLVALHKKLTERFVFLL